MCVKLKANSLCFIFSVIAVFYGTYHSTTNEIEKEKNYEKVNFPTQTIQIDGRKLQSGRCSPLTKL